MHNRIASVALAASGALVALVVLGGGGGCTSVRSSPASDGGSSAQQSVPSTSVAVGPSNLVVTDQVRAQLVAAGAQLNGLPGSDYTGLRPGETYLGYDPATKTSWAGAGLVASPASTPAQVSTQDDGAYLLFERSPGGPWVAHDVGLAGVEGATCPVLVPVSILRLWGWPPGSCRPPTIS